MDRLEPPSILTQPVTRLSIFITVLILAVLGVMHNHSEFITEKAADCGANSALIRTLTIWDAETQTQKTHYEEVYGCVYYDDIRVYPIPGEDT